MTIMRLAATALLLAVSLIGTLRAGGQAGPGIAGDPGAALESLADDLRAEYGLPGIIIAFRQGDHPVHVLVSGVRRVGHDADLKADDRMHLGSVSKSLAATVIGDLVADGLLAWETRLLDVFPELAERTLAAFRGVTVQDLLNHEARFLPFTDDTEIARAPAFTGSPRRMREAFVAWAVTQPSQVVPPDDDPYSNAGYTVLAAVAERVTDQSFERLCQERLFNRLDLRTAGFGWPTSVDEAAPWGHWHRHGTFVPHPPNDDYRLGPMFAAAGDMHMSVPDLLTFGEAHLAALAGSEDTFDPGMVRRLHMTETGYASGWYVRPTGHYHTGSAQTFFATLLVSPARDTVIALATNGSDPEHEFALAGKVLGRVYRAYGVMNRNDEDGVPVDEG